MRANTKNQNENQLNPGSRHGTMYLWDGSEEMYYFPHYVPKNHVPGQRVKLRYWSKGERIVELSDVDAADIEMEATK